MLGVVSERGGGTGVGVVLLLAVVSDGQVVVLVRLRVAAAGHGDNAHPGHEQGEVAGVHVAHGAQQAVHRLLQHDVARQRHGPLVQQPAGGEIITDESTCNSIEVKSVLQNAFCCTKVKSNCIFPTLDLNQVQPCFYQLLVIKNDLKNRAHQVQYSTNLNVSFTDVRIGYLCVYVIHFLFQYHFLSFPDCTVFSFIVDVIMQLSLQ